MELNEDTILKQKVEDVVARIRNLENRVSKLQFKLNKEERINKHLIAQKELLEDKSILVKQQSREWLEDLYYNVSKEDLKKEIMSRLDSR